MAILNDKTRISIEFTYNRIRSATLESSIHWFLKRLHLTTRSLKQEAIEASIIDANNPGNVDLGKERSKTIWKKDGDNWKPYLMKSDGSWGPHYGAQTITAAYDFPYDSVTTDTVIDEIDSSEIELEYPKVVCLDESEQKFRAKLQDLIEENYLATEDDMTIYNAAEVFGASLRKTGLFSNHGQLEEADAPLYPSVGGELSENKDFQKKRHPSRFFDKPHRNTCSDTPPKLADGTTKPLPTKPLPTIPGTAKNNGLFATKKPLPNIPGQNSSRRLPKIPAHDNIANRKVTRRVMKQLSTPVR